MAIAPRPLPVRSAAVLRPFDESDVARLIAVDRERTCARLATLTADFDEVVSASRDTNADDEHDPEGTTIAFERSQVGALVTSARAHLAELDEAEARLADGSYGMCERCGGPIGAARLEVRPAARHCIICA